MKGMDYREEYERKTGESVIELIGKVENTVFMIDPEPQLEIKKFKNKYVKFLEQKLQEKDKVIEELPEILKQTLLNYRMPNILDENDDAYPIVDLLTCDGKSIQDGINVIDDIVDDFFINYEER